jgi:hypothetical protein
MKNKKSQILKTKQIIPEKRKNCEKGSSLVEILFAVAILSILMIGILQMFSAAYVVNKYSALKTLEAYKCEQVAENIRMLRRLAIANAGVLPASVQNSGVNFLQDGFIGFLPFNSGDDPGLWAYWGPGGANVIEEPHQTFRLFYRISTNPQSGNLSLTVVAVPSDKIEDGQDPFNNPVSAYGRVEYVTEMR